MKRNIWEASEKRQLLPSVQSQWSLKGNNGDISAMSPLILQDTQNKRVHWVMKGSLEAALNSILYSHSAFKCSRKSKVFNVQRYINQKCLVWLPQQMWHFRFIDFNVFSLSATKQQCAENVNQSIRNGKVRKQKSYRFAFHTNGTNWERDGRQLRDWVTFTGIIEKWWGTDVC